MICLIECLVCPSIVGPHSMPIMIGGQIWILQPLTRHRQRYNRLAKLCTLTSMQSGSGRFLLLYKFTMCTHPFHINWLIRYYKFAHICNWLGVCLSNASVSIVRVRDRSQKRTHSKGWMQTRFSNKEFVFPDAVIEDVVGTHYVLLIHLSNSM